MVVIDASVVIKWFKPDEKFLQADFILEEHITGRESIFVPTLLLYEFTNALFYSKSLNFLEISEYDSSYIALAKNFNCGLITADKKLFQGAKSFVDAAFI